MATKKTTQSDAFAIIETGGKQYKVSVGDVVTIGKIADAPETGSTMSFDKVLLVANGSDAKIGAPYVSGAKVEAEFQGEGKGKKLNIMRFRQKSRYTRRIGYRDTNATVKITNIA